jgi:hypothetical protein
VLRSHLTSPLPQKQNGDADVELIYDTAVGRFPNRFDFWLCYASHALWRGRRDFAVEVLTRCARQQYSPARLCLLCQLYCITFGGS